MNERIVKPLKDLLRNVTQGEETVFDIAEKAAVGDAAPKLTVEVRQRELNPEPPPVPVKAPSPRRAHLFHNLSGFIAYLKKFGGENTVLLGDAATERIAVTLDERAVDGFELLLFEPLVHPLFLPWARFLASKDPVPLKIFVEFLRANRRVVTDPSPRDLILTLQQVRVSKKVELNQGVGTHSVNGLMVETTIQGQTQTNLVELPETLRLTVPLYVDTAEVQIEVDLALSADERTGVLVALSSADVPVARMELFEGFLADAQKELGDKFTVGMGRPATAAWDILR